MSPNERLNNIILERTIEYNGATSEYPATNLCKLVAGYSEVAPLYSIVLSSMMLFKRSFGLTRSLFILYVHEHDRLGFGMLTVETAVIHLMSILIVPIATEKVSRIRSNIIWNRWKNTLRARSI